MTNILIGIFLGPILFLPMFYIIGKCLGWDKDEEYTSADVGGYDVRPKNYKTAEKNNQSNFTIYMHDDEYTSMHLNEDKNIIAFISCSTNNIKTADIYFSLMVNERIITIIYYDGEKERVYKTWITELKIIDENTLRIYYRVIR